MSHNQLFSNAHKRSFLYKCSLILIFFLAISTFFSPLRALPYFNKLWAICIVGWFVFTIIDSPKYIFRPSVYRLSVYIYIIYTIIIAYITDNFDIGNRFFELAQIPLFYMAYQKNKLIGGNKDNWLIIACTTPFVLLTSYSSINILKANPFASRGAGNLGETGLELLKSGVGGYHFIYFIVIIFAILLFVLFNKTHVLKIIPKIIGIGFLLIFAINIVLSNYTTALLLLTLSILMRIIGKSIFGKNLIIHLLGIVLLLIFSSFLLQNFLNYTIELLGSSSNAQRFFEIENYLFYAETGLSLEARLNVFNESIQVFFQNPFFGIIFSKLSFSQDGIMLLRFGNHSQILDTFALYGLGIGILQLYIYLHPILSRTKNINGTFSILSLTIMMLLCILFSINTATPSIGFAVFYIFPTTYDWLQSNINSDTQ